MFRESSKAGVNMIRTVGKGTDSEEISSTMSIHVGTFKYECIALNEVVAGYTMMMDLKNILVFFI